MSDDGLLTAEQLHKITQKKRAHCQQAWFQREFGIVLPRNSERVIISRSVFESLQAKRAGLLPLDAPTERPKLYSLKKTA